MHEHYLDPGTDEWKEVIPLPYYYGLFPWLYRRLTGWRDNYGRKAQLCFPLLNKYR